MSSASAPISSTAFVIAIKDLPLPNLYAKAGELQNSIAHLKHSNDQLQPFAEDGDQDCQDAVQENEEVVGRMEERILLLRKEVEDRGARWMEAEVEEKEAREGSGIVVDGVNGDSTTGSTSAVAQAQTEEGEGRGGRLSDEELQARLQDVMENSDQDDDGVHL
ncbi:MAG: hypothetical protein M1837_004953 [Sclerophora amabilis]|nr:MAG: hypothetical protein M1837_004953 [Sclerophora amabilis]